MPRPTALRALPQPGGDRVEFLALGWEAAEEGEEFVRQLGRVREEQSCLAVGDEFGDAAVVDGEHGQLAPEHVHHLHGEVEARGGGVEAEP
eukprot:CAMPEP_0180171822 /NCGR_PEP_ID=MMETSP0986-20121125/34656_1 /TAXON_ID=697907 /ORGANISM="non described non described, Strain CCMP2293" /LENGTH=90 /DNA_ID=CAMNT_0022123787 /DNA_START=189 /DNA_END=462 /DNA_ORIENTATION=-